MQRGPSFWRKGVQTHLLVTLIPNFLWWQKYLTFCSTLPFLCQQWRRVLVLLGSPPLWCRDIFLCPRIYPSERTGHKHQSSSRPHGPHLLHPCETLPDSSNCGRDVPHLILFLYRLRFWWRTGGRYIRRWQTGGGRSSCSQRTWGGSRRIPSLSTSLSRRVARKSVYQFYILWI